MAKLDPLRQFYLEKIGLLKLNASGSLVEYIDQFQGLTIFWREIYKTVELEDSLVTQMVEHIEDSLYYDSCKNVVPQERIRTVNTLRGQTEFLANKTIKVNPNGGKQVGIPEKEYPGIANHKGYPNRRQTELVPRRPRESSNEDPSGSNSKAPAKAKMNPQNGISFEFHVQVRSKRAPKGNKFLGA